MAKYLTFLSLILGVLTHFSVEAYMMHKTFPITQEWQEEPLAAFDELMLSWNAKRPSDGRFLFYISVKVDEWSPWLLYASWGSDGQSSYDAVAKGKTVVKVFQDALEVGKKAMGFRIKIVTEGKASLDDIYSLHVYTNGGGMQEPLSFNSQSPLIHLPVQGLSQMALDHVRNSSLCSPISVTAVVRYLSDKKTLDPIFVAKNVWDAGFDIYGNWVFNVAAAAEQLGADWSCWVERLPGFESIYKYLQEGFPVVVSIRGPLAGSAQPYNEGHLVVVTGYDPTQQRVLCMDPAFLADTQTTVSYDLVDFLRAWSRRGNIAYVFRNSANF